jgi:DNA invertase Pin-like site-specific DNA recombinase
VRAFRFLAPLGKSADKVCIPWDALEPASSSHRSGHVVDRQSRYTGSRQRSSVRTVERCTHPLDMSAGFLHLPGQQLREAMANVGYKRVSTVDQNTGRQLEGIELDEVFEDKCSGKNTERAALQECLRFVRRGDVLWIHSLDRAARNLMDLRTITTDLVNRGVQVRYVKEGLIFGGSASTTPMSQLLLNVMGAFAEFERALILERQREGIAVARAAGRYAKPRQRKLKADQVQKIIEQVAAGVPKSRVAKAYGISRETLYVYLRAAKSTAQAAH